MKKALAIIFTLIMLITMSACGGGDEPQEAPAEDSLKVKSSTIVEIINKIENEEIWKGYFDSSDENRVGKFDDYSSVNSLLDILKDATFEDTAKPSTPYKSFDGILINTSQCEYSIFVINNSVLRITYGAKGNCYTCDKTTQFLNALNELQKILL